MTVRRQEQPKGAPHQGGSRSDDRGVSPVVGMILVLAISIVGISAILYWGLPALDEMKANVEYRAVTGQFTELDGTIKELAAGTTEKTAKRWQPSFNRGSLSILNNTEGWLVAVEPYNAGSYDFVWDAMADGNARFTVKQAGTDAISNWKVEAYVVTGTTSLTTVNASIFGSGPAQMGVQGTAWAAGATKEFELYVKDASPAATKPLTGGTFKIKIYSGSTLLAEGWYVNTGRIDYRLSGGVTEKSLVENNGAVIAGTDGSFALINTPPFPPPTTTGGTYRLFGRLVALQGDATFAGDNRFDALISLYSTATLASYDCALAGTTKADCVETVKIFNYGTYQDPWYTYLTSQGRGYRFTEESGGYLLQRESAMAFTLLGSTITFSG